MCEYFTTREQSLISLSTERKGAQCMTIVLTSTMPTVRYQARAPG